MLESLNECQVGGRFHEDIQYENEVDVINIENFFIFFSNT